MANLLILTGAQQGRRLPLQGDKIVLGREFGCDIEIKESMLHSHPDGPRTESISRKHAIISCEGGKYFIEDGDGQGNKSRNKTFVNDREVPFPTRQPLRNNDRIRLCDFVCTFHEGANVGSLVTARLTPVPQTTTALAAGSSVESSIDQDSGSAVLQTQPAEKLRGMLAIIKGLSKTLELDILLPRIVEDLFQLFKQADRGFIILCDETTQEPVTHAFKARLASPKPDTRFSVSIVKRCINTGEAILGNDVVRQFPDSQSICDLPIRSLMCAALFSQNGQPLGAIQLDTQDPKKKFTEDDLNLLLGVASQASIALCNARLYQDSLDNQRHERDLEVAHQVQRALLPQQPPDIPGCEFFAYYESALEVGGDFFDFIPLPQQRLAVLLGDVAGKGVAAALIMVKFSVEARVCLLTEPDLAAAVTKLNTVMNRVCPSDTFVTLAAVVLDLATYTAHLVNAGHPSPLLFHRATGAVEEAAPTEVAGTPLGILDDQVYACRQVQLQPGDSLLLFSDGITEAMDANGRLFRMKGVQAVFGDRSLSPRETGDRLIQAVKKHSSGCSQHDDITLVCFGRAGE